MITSTTTNYAGREIDLCLFPTLRSPSVKAPMSVEGPGRVVAGPTKAAQGFLQALLSLEGEFSEDPFFGSNFTVRMRSQSVRYLSDIDQIFTLEASKAIDWWNGVSAARPPDERIKSVEIVAQNIGPTDMSLSLQLTTQSGGNLSFLLPVGWSSSN